MHTEFGAFKDKGNSARSAGDNLNACAPSWDKPMTMLGVHVAPYVFVVADTDGVLVLPQADVDRAMTAGIEREEKEAAFMEKLRNGATTLELMGLS